MLWLILLVYHVSRFGVEDYATDYMTPLSLFQYRITFACFLAVTTFAIGRVFSKIEKLNVLTLLWRLFMIGILGITGILLLIILRNYTQYSALSDYLDPVFFSVALYILLGFFLSALFIFRRFILYQRTITRLRGWYLLMGLLGLMLLTNVYPSIFSYYSFGYIIFILYLIAVLIMAANVRWISYLNFNQKLQSLGIFSLILVLIVAYIFVAIRFPEALEIAVSEVPGQFFILCIIIFAIIYSTFSILVLFFNLPTSSIFELQSLEIASFHNINQAIQSNLDFTDIMNSLLDASVLAANAKSGWLEMMNEETGESEVKLCKRITLEEIEVLTRGQKLTEKVLKDRKYYLIRNTRSLRLKRKIDSKFRCLLCIPILSNSQQYGAIFIANELTQSFEDVTIESVVSFAEQAGIALENAKLVKDSIEMERYREQLKIAKDVQNQLLPKHLPKNANIEFHSLNENAFEVGGDYYDVIGNGDDLFKIAIGDVSGKGTTAAFYMAEIKGIFHALTRMNLSPKKFIEITNQALSDCMQKGSYMTLTYLEINTAENQIELIRAGHCPTFYYNSKTDNICMLRDGTLGLGIVRNGAFKNYIGESQQLIYSRGDVLLLYTDGIVEARNEEGVEFGYDRVKDIFFKNRHRESKYLASQIVQEVKNFSQNDLQDDYTILIIRFL